MAIKLGPIKGVQKNDVASLVKAFKKDFGEATAITGGQEVDVPRIPTGILHLDIATGGGIPKGRNTIIYGPESSGKTNICLKIIANYQRLYPKETCVFVDIEGTYDVKWAKKLGVDVDSLVRLRPLTAEEAVDMVQAVLLAEDCGLVVVDSLAALITDNEAESEAAKAAVGGASAHIGKMVRKTTQALNKADMQGRSPTLIYVNQTRFKVGFVLGDPECLHADTIVPFVDGSSHTIREIVENKIFGKVWSIDPLTHAFSQQEIVSHHFNGMANDGDFVTITARGVDTRNGVFSATVSRTHKILTQDENFWVEAGNLQKDDLLFAPTRKTSNPLVQAFMDGVFVGDSTLTNANRGNKRGFRLQDGYDPEYLQWKAKLIAEHYPLHQDGNCVRVSEQTSFWWDYGVMAGELTSKEELSSGLFMRRSPEFLDFHPLMLAVWFMDDGHYARGRYTLAAGRARNHPYMREIISDKFAALGINGSWSKSGKSFFVDTASSRVLAEMIAPYVPPCMHRKLPEDLRGPGIFTLGPPAWTMLDIPCEVLSVKPASKRKYRQRGLYDIHVSGPNNYLVGNSANGFVVHNTMPGGNAIKFQVSLWLRVYGKNLVDSKVNKDMPVRKEIRAVIKKWKVPIYHVNAEFEMAMIPHDGLKIGQVKDEPELLIDYLKETSLITQMKGGWGVMGETYKTQEEICARWYKDLEWSDQLRKKIVTACLLSYSSEASD